MARSVNEISTPELKAMRDLCPTRRDKIGISLTHSGLGVETKTVHLTYEMRQRIEAELKRRRLESK